MFALVSSFRGETFNTRVWVFALLSHRVCWSKAFDCVDTWLLILTPWCNTLAGGGGVLRTSLQPSVSLSQIANIEQPLCDLFTWRGKLCFPQTNSWSTPSRRRSVPRIARRPKCYDCSAKYPWKTLFCCFLIESGPSCKAQVVWWQQSMTNKEHGLAVANHESSRGSASSHMLGCVQLKTRPWWRRESGGLQINHSTPNHRGGK